MKISIYGCGYVGLVSAACFAKLGHDVLAMDIDASKIVNLKNGLSPIFENGLTELLTSSRLRFTSDFSEAVEFSTVQFICVGTPQSESGAADLSYVHACAKKIGDLSRENKIIVIKSTVPIGTGDELALQIAQRHQDYQFSFISNPEFLREGLAVQDFLKPERVIIGGDDYEAINTVASLYNSIIHSENALLKMARRSSEFCKYASNAMLATRISFMNEMSQIADRVGANIDDVALGMGLDSRIGPLFLRAGCGYGGSCFPKDVSALRYLANANGYDPQILNAVEEVNQQQKLVLVDKICQHFGDDLSGKTFALWGLAFKPDTDDIREASSLVIIKELLARHASIQAFDPVASHNARVALGERENMAYSDDPYQALKGADALIIATEWSLFREADRSVICESLKNPVIFDGRNIFKSSDWQPGTYYSIGRPV